VNLGDATRTLQTGGSYTIFLHTNSTTIYVGYTPLEYYRVYVGSQWNAIEALPPYTHDAKLPSILG